VRLSTHLVGPYIQCSADWDRLANRARASSREIQLGTGRNLPYCANPVCQSHLAQCSQLLAAARPNDRFPEYIALSSRLAHERPDGSALVVAIGLFHDVSHALSSG
jgi:hypothetical protein